MPSEIKPHIKRIEILIDKLSDLSHKIQFDINQGATSSEQIEVVDMWSKLRNALQELIFLNDAIDHAQEGLKDPSVPEQTKQVLRDRLGRDLQSLPRKLNSLLRLEKKAIAVYDTYKDIKAPKKEEPKQRQEESKPKAEVVKEKQAVLKEKKAIKAKSSKIDQTKDDVLDSFNKKIADMEGAANNILGDALSEYFDIKNGKIIVGEDFIKQLNKLTVNVLDLLQKDPSFSGPVSQFVKRMPQIAEAITDFQLEANGIKVPAMETVKKVIQDEVIDQMLNNGLNQAFVQPLRDLIFQNAISGLSLKEAKTQIKEFIKGGKDVSGKLGRYLDQTAEQAVDSYSGAINKKLHETFNYDGLLMTGSLIDNSSPQCRFVIEELKGTITKENWPQVVAHVGKNAQLIEGTTFENLPLNRLHWGCRHSFYPIMIKKT